MKKTTKLLTVILVLGMMMGIFATFGITASAAPATTTVDGTTYYEIGSAEDLVWFANEVNDNDKYKINARLTANIDLSSVCSETLGSWTPISGYQGIFDGAGFEISGLYCTGQEMGGLFGMLYDANAVVKNVTVRGYVSGTSYVGGIVGYLYSSGAKIINCVNYATISVSNTSYTNDILVGGIVGYVNGAESLVEDCINYGDVIANPIDPSSEVTAGGIAGQASTGATIRNCENYGDINDGDTTSNGWIRFGGIVGFTRGNVINCYSEGDLHQYGVKNTQELGGIAGSAYDSAKIENCFNNGSISSDANACLGAVTGELFGTINNTYWNTEKTSLNASDYLGSASTVNNTSGLSATELATGVVAYNMGDDWGQKIGTDPIPVLGGLKVYRNVEPTSTCSNPVYYYSNSEDTNINHDTTLGAESFTDGVCNNCGYACTHPSATFTYSNATNTSHDATYNCCNKLLSGEAHSFGTTDTCPCGETADASLTKGSTVSYYATLEEAITAARSATDSTVTLLDNCSPEVGYWFTISDGKFTLDLNGKQITVVNSAYSAIVVESGNITLTDSAGGGGSNGGALVRGGGTLRVEGGTYGGKVSTTNGNLIVVGGSFAKVSLDYDENPGTISLMGGKIATLQVRAQSGGKKMADVIVQDYYLADENGVLIDPNDAQLSDTYFYYLENVTVQRGADLSANAVVTVENAIYNGSKQVPEVTVTVLGRELMMGVDFSFTYPEGYDITNAGTTTLTIKGIGSYYTGETTATYTIEKRTLTESDITPIGLNTTYNLNPQTVSVSLPTGLDAQYVTLVYVDGITAIEGGPTDAGSYKVLVKVEGSPNYKNVTLEYDMVISPAPVKVYIDPTAEFIFNLNSHTPDVAVEINGGLPFDPTLYGGTVKYEDNYNAGTATVTVGGNFVGSTTFTIKKAIPQVDLGAPIDTVLGGFIMDVEPTTTAVDKIAESITLTVLDGEGYSVSGNRITIDDGVVIGSTITVLVEYPGSTNYEKTVTEHTLTVGVPAVNTDQLENKIAALEELADTKASAAELASAIDELEVLINNAEITAKNYTDGKADELTDAIADAKAEVTTAYTAAINDAKAELKELIDLKADKTALDKAIDELEALIADAEAAAKNYTDGKADELTDALNTAKTELTDAIADAKAEVTTAYTAAINDAKAELKELIDLKADKTALDNAIDELETLIADAEAAAKAYTDTKAGELSDALNTAKAELTEAIKAAKTELTEAYTAAIEDAKAELNDAIISGDTALEIKIANLTDALERARAALKSADQHNKAELEKAIANGDAALAEAINEAEERIKELENALTNAKFNLNQKDKELDSTVGALTTGLIVIGVVAGVGFAGCATLTVMTVISRRKTVGKKDKK